MQDQFKAKKELIQELDSLRQRIAELDQSELARKRAEESLRKRETHYRALFDTSPDGIFMIDQATGHLIAANAAASRLYGYTEDEFRRMKHTDIAAEPEKTKTAVQDSITKVPIRLHCKKDGTVFPVEITGGYVEHDGRAYHTAFIRDITKRMQVEEDLPEREQRYSFLIRNTSDYIGCYSPSGILLFASEALYSITGYKPEELIGTSGFNRVHPDDRPQVQAALTEAVKTCENQKVEYRTLCKDGRYRWVESSGKMVRNDQAGQEEIIAIIRDIDDRKQLYSDLEKSREKYRSIFENAVEGIFQTTKDGRFLSANPALARIFGYDSPDDLMASITNIGRQLYVSDEERKEHLRLINENGELKDFEARMQRKDGSTCWVSINTRLVKSDDGKDMHYEGFMMDISFRKQAEEALRENEDLFRSLFDYMHDVMIILDWDGSILFANRGAAKIIGHERSEELVGHNMIEYLHPDSLQKAADDLEAVKAGRMGFLSEYQLRSVTGRHIWVESIGGKIIFRRATANLVCIRDITDRKRMEEELLRAHKLESLGVLAGGIAHDFNNLMAIVQGYIDLALMEIPPEHVSRQRLLTAMRSVEQTKDLTSRLITFSRGGGPHMAIFDIMEVIRDAVHRTVKGTNAKVKFDFEKNLWPVEADELQMKQCFYNLTTNAVEAMPEGGNLTIRVKNVLIPARGFPGLKEGSYLKITFADEGVGIPEVHLAKIFDPYFTTKKIAAQKGLGLGLSVCYSVMKNHNGHIKVKSQLGKGTSFILYLTARPDLAKEKIIEKKSLTGTARVLVMDDEPHIREIERAYLARMGHEVTDVKDGQDAIDTYSKALQSGTPFDLVVLDLTVHQGMGGQMAMERLLKIDPSIKAVIVSGYVDDPVIENYSGYGFKGALKKPFKRKEIESLVEKVLQG